MAKHWTAIENQQFIDIMKQYRESIKDQKEAKSIKKITDSFVNDLLLNSVLANRSKQAIYEHITYFDEIYWMGSVKKKTTRRKMEYILIPNEENIKPITIHFVYGEMLLTNHNTIKPKKWSN